MNLVWVALLLAAAAAVAVIVLRLLLRGSVSPLLIYAKQRGLKVASKPDEERLNEVSPRGKLSHMGSRIRNIVETVDGVILMEYQGGRWRPGDFIVFVKGRFASKHILLPASSAPLVAGGFKEFMGARYPSLQRLICGSEAFRREFLAYTNRVEDCRGFVFRAENALLSFRGRWPLSQRNGPVVFDVEDGFMYIFTPKPTSVEDVESALALAAAVEKSLY